MWSATLAAVAVVLALQADATRPEAAPAAAANQKEAFYAAAKQAQSGDAAGAAAAYLAIADAHPDDLFADDALSEAAQLYERELADPLRALEVYRRIVRDYPESRVAVRARRRAAALEEGLGPDGAGAAALAAWSKILNDYPTRSRRESIALAEQLLAEHPEFAQAPQVEVWIGSQLEAEGERAAALARYRAVQTRWPEDPWALRARRAEAELLVDLGRYDEAERVYESLRGADPRGDIGLDDALERLHEARRWARLGTLAWLLLAAWLLATLASARLATASAGAAARALARPPLELWFLLPVATIVSVAAFSENQSIARAVVVTSAAALVVTWLSGAALAAARPVRAARATVHAVLGALAVLAVAYLAIRWFGLLDLVAHTLRFGHD